MAVPVISTTQSVLGFLQRQAFAFQPFASGTPTGWAATTALPPGLTLNATTGVLSGAVTLPGVYLVGLTAANADGISSAVVFCIGIEASSPTSGADLDVEWDVVTGDVRLAGAIAPTGETTGAPLSAAKLADDRILSVRLTKAGVGIDLAAVEVTAAFVDEDDSPLLVSDGWWKEGAGEMARYRVHLVLAGAALTGDVADEPAIVKGELKIRYTNPDAEHIGPAVMRLGSGTFNLRVAKNLNV